MNISTSKTNRIPSEELNHDWRDMFKSTETTKELATPAVLEP